ncbi:MAG TPA: DUF1848 domain-containing protein [Kiritimatiellia bacterium]|nr:DUF1848 domain-containing protein [Kiritimatiellia bacterium]HPS07167.1 DUF1848 domain-containing protein [Kiritimatiellia bacterium]
MTKDKIQITDDSGTNREAQAPVIVSASRSTDIPAFYGDWLMNRLRKGHVMWRNPFNGQPLYVSFAKTRVLVFWTKNPKPLLVHLDELDAMGLHYYFQFTLNDYVAEGLEPHVPIVDTRIETFRELSGRVGRNRVIWRFDPLMLTDTISVDALLCKAKRIGDELAGFTSRMVFSFVDLDVYGSVKANLKKDGVSTREFTGEEMHRFAKGLSEFNRKWKFQLGTCAEKVDFSEYGIEHNRCVDDRLMAQEFGDDRELMDFLGFDNPPCHDIFGSLVRKDTKSRKDKGQREACGCVVSKDIGAYNTCPHMCRYCYANHISFLVVKNHETCLRNAQKESIM